MNRDDLRRLFEHMWWADERAAEALAGADAPPAKALELQAHVLGAELVWLDRIEGTTSDAEVWPAADAERRKELARRAREGYARLLDRLDDEGRALAESIAYRNSAGQEFTTRLDDILLHVALHGAYHRGQIASMLREVGAEPSPTDYIAFARGAPAATRRDTD